MRFLLKSLRPRIKWTAFSAKSSAATQIAPDYSNENNAANKSPPSLKSPSVIHDPKLVREEIERCYKRLDLSFENTKEAFRSKSNWDLWRQYIVLRLCGIDFLVKHSNQAIALGRRTLGKRLFGLLMRATFYGHFVAGEDQESIKPVVSKLRRFGVKSILDYSVEADVEGGEETEAGGKLNVFGVRFWDVMKEMQIRW